MYLYKRFIKGLDQNQLPIKGLKLICHSDDDEELLKVMKNQMKKGVKKENIFITNIRLPKGYQDIKDQTNEVTRLFIENNYKITKIKKEDVNNNFINLVASKNKKLYYYSLKVLTNKDSVFPKWELLKYEDMNIIPTIDIIEYFSNIENKNFLFIL